MKKEVDLEAIHPLETHIPSRMESSQMTKSEMDQHRQNQTMDLSHSALAGAAGSAVVTTPPRNITNNVQGVGQVHVHPEDRSLANSGELKLFHTHAHYFWVYCVLRI
jgi:hypothetical protein